MLGVRSPCRGQLPWGRAERPSLKDVPSALALLHPVNSQSLGPASQLPRVLFHLLSAAVPADSAVLQELELLFKVRVNRLQSPCSLGEGGDWTKLLLVGSGVIYLHRMRFLSAGLKLCRERRWQQSRTSDGSCFQRAAGQVACATLSSCRQKKMD